MPPRTKRERARLDREAMEPFMRLALREAEKGLGRTSPNPPVGAVVVRDGRVIARGHHARAGGPHAEVVALRAAGDRARDADLYTTLEPCDHWGKTPPCSIAILEAGIRRVFVGSRDPNPLVNGKGITRLRRAGVSVTLDVLRDACDTLNAPWFHFIRTGRPFVTLKVALTLDGRIATASGDARWITGEEARAEVHRMRDQADAILVGAGTARTDDPQLTTRLPGGRGHHPIRIVLDSGRRALPRGLKVFSDGAAPTLLATTRTRVRAPEGVEVVRVRGEAGRALPFGLARTSTTGLRPYAQSERIGRSPEQSERKLRSPFGPARTSTTGLRPYAQSERIGRSPEQSERKLRSPLGLSVGAKRRSRSPARGGWADLGDLLSQLGDRGITHLLVEGGAATHRSFLEAGLVDRVVAFVAPKILGGGRLWLDGAGPDRMADALALQDVEVRQVGEDVMVVGTLAPRRR